VSTSIGCPACGRSAEPAQRFCGACGSALQQLCEQCGASSPPGFRYCGQCGAVLGGDRPAASAPETGEERRWATVLFADLSGFTALSERTDPEDVRSMVDRCMRTMSETVERFGGAVDKVIGDALMAVFGAPVAHDDDPARAVRAALEIQQQASENAEDFCNLQVRVGVNTGEVLFAPVGPDSRRELTVMGDAVNTAARLQAAAPAGGVMVGEPTREATGADIEFEEVAPVLAKGKSAPLRAWLARSATPAPAERLLSDAPFVGRDTELDLLWRTWERTRTQLRPALVTVVGPTGVGKSRLARELARRVAQDGGGVLRGRSLPYGERTAYGAFAQVITEACGILANDDARAARAKLVRRLEGLLPGEDPELMAVGLSILARLTEETVEDRELLFASAQRFLEALARERSTLIVLEDLQWADHGLLALLAALAARLADARLLVLTLARPEFLDAEPDWAQLPTNVTLPLEALADADAEQLAGLLLEQLPDTRSAVERVKRAGGGNPLLIEEIAAWLCEGAEPGSEELPSNVKAMIAARLDQLPAPERQLLLSAAVVGEVFWEGSLRALEAQGPIDQLLLSLERRDLIRRIPRSRIEGDRELSFKHALTRDVAYSMLPLAARRERHASVARFIEASAGNSAASASALAHHWRHAGEGARAVDYLVVAADQAGRGWAQQEAIALCDQALELIPEGDEERKRRVRLRRYVAMQKAWHGQYDLRGQSKSAGETSPPIS
jgi:class 3 adenylate cyclase